MATLIIRLTGIDTRFVSGLLAPPRRGTAVADRIVIEAHTAAKSTAFSEATRQAGVPLLIDPQTFYLPDHQHPADPWALLPFATPAPVSVSDLMNLGRADRLIAETIEFQLSHHASAVIAPYIHIESATDGWTEVQALLYRRTRRYLDQTGVRLPVLAPVALSWRLLDRTRWPASLDRLIAALAQLAPDEVALAASKVHTGAHVERRLADLCATVARLGRRWPVLAWRQGLFGEACVAAGAVGYETGIGWGERCDLRQRMAQHRRPPGDGGAARPIYSEVLGASLPKRTLQAVINEPIVGPKLTCLDPRCCPHGKRDLIGDARSHAVAARSRRLAAVSAAAHPRWAWQLLAGQASEAILLGERINLLAARGVAPTRVDLTGFRAIEVTAKARRQQTGRHHAA
ncbi:MAG TPA: hypothetical protein VGB75_10055 [Jatrophihabitans sp.]|uniref:hypothetical protein n=1 Tax=Jatrophihabitans sp. TaxID=1932789 RepID=UPI002EDBBD70